MRALITSSVLLLIALTSGVQAAETMVKARSEVNWRYGSDRSILKTEFWVPFIQRRNYNDLLYGSLRMMGDDHENKEGNLGLGYRRIKNLPVLGQGVFGVHGWIDRRITAYNSKFHQITTGAEWLGLNLDLHFNVYTPLSGSKEHIVPYANPLAPAFAGTGILVDTNGRVLEEPQRGFDVEVGWELGHEIEFLRDHTDSFRIYGGAYYFNGDQTNKIAGMRARLAADITQDFQLGARLQHDAERGTQGFLEATLRFPFGNKKSYRTEGVQARLDENPERDIDIVTASKITDAGSRVSILNKVTGSQQQVLHVDNTAGGGGDGSVENPFNNLAAAQAAAGTQSIIYVNRGDGTDTNQDQGIRLDKTGQQLIGSGIDFVYDSARFTTANGNKPASSTIIAAATLAPVISNTNPNGDGVTVNADNVSVKGITVDGASRYGILVEADGAAATAQNINIESVTAQNNNVGFFLHATNAGQVSALMQSSVATANTQHGVAVYDDTNQTFEIDLGGGSLGSSGQNVFSGNTLEDLAIDYDGQTLAAMNNWWGQATGPDTDNPSIGIRPQIYYGAPINSGLLGHWTFDTEWTDNATAYDRSGLAHNGTLQNGLSLANMENGQYRQGLHLDGTNDHVTLGTGATYIPAANSNITIWASFNPDVIPVAAIDRRLVNIRRSTGGSTIAFGVGSSDNATYFTANTNTQILADTVIATSAHSTSALTYDGATLRGYVNGTLDSNVQNTAIFAGVATQAMVGSYDGNNFYFDGVIDDVRIYNRALAASEISELNRMDTTSAVNTGGFLTAAP